jgi:hypothetical protein
MKDKLNLDELLPESREVTFNGKDYEVKPPTVEQMLRVADLDRVLYSSNAENVEDVLEIINSTLEPVVPDIRKMNLTKEQLLGLMSFILKTARPESLEKVQNVTPKKKQDSPKQ